MNNLLYTALLFASLAFSPLSQAADEKPAAPDPIASLRSDIAMAQRDYFVALKDESDAKLRQGQITQALMQKYSQAQSLCTESHQGTFDPATLKCKIDQLGTAAGAAPTTLPPAQVPHPPPPPAAPAKR